MTKQPFDAEFEHEFDEVERYEFREPKPYLFQADRREFVQTLGTESSWLLPRVAHTRNGGGRVEMNRSRNDFISVRMASLPC